MELFYELVSGGVYVFLVFGWCLVFRRFRCYYLVGRVELIGGCVGGLGFFVVFLILRCLRI